MDLGTDQDFHAPYVPKGSKQIRAGQYLRRVDTVFSTGWDDSCTDSDPAHGFELCAVRGSEYSKAMLPKGVLIPETSRAFPLWLERTPA
jgi:hypothetical protein